MILVDEHQVNAGDTEGSFALSRLGAERTTRPSIALETWLNTFTSMQSHWGVRHPLAEAVEHA
jgi:hypothetical protein